jgi:hypothetical protein
MYVQGKALSRCTVWFLKLLESAQISSSCWWNCKLFAWLDVLKDTVLVNGLCIASCTYRYYWACSSWVVDGVVVLGVGGACKYGGGDVTAYDGVLHWMNHRSNQSFCSIGNRISWFGSQCAHETALAKDTRRKVRLNELQVTPLPHTGWSSEKKLGFLHAHHHTPALITHPSHKHPSHAHSHTLPSKNGDNLVRWFAGHANSLFWEQ